MKEGAVPKVLEERLLINEDDRILLKTMEELSPRDTGTLLASPSIFENYVPSLNDISKKVGKSKTEVWSQMNKIRDVWKLPKPEDLPTNNGFFDKEDALVNALVNQHKLRWDKNLGNYRVPKIHMFSAEMGFGQLYANDDAFLGEQIIRQAMGLDEMLNSYHMQGGVMPEMISMFGKAKNYRALLIGFNKTGEAPEENEGNFIRKKLGLWRGEVEMNKPLTKKMIKNIDEWAVGTLNSRKEAAKSVAYEAAVTLKNIPPHVPIHVYFSYNDDANMSEIEDEQIAILRKLGSRMAEATEKLPELKEEKDKFSKKEKTFAIQSNLADLYYDRLLKIKRSKKDKFVEKGDSFRQYTKDFFEVSEGIIKSDLLKKLRDKTERSLGYKIEDETFDVLSKIEINSFYEDITTFKKVAGKKKASEKTFERIKNKVSSLESAIDEAEAFMTSHLVEEMEGHAWLTKKIAIKPGEAKALQTFKKESYKELYTNIMFPEIEKILGRKLKLILHTDSIITNEIPDPQYLIESEKTENGNSKKRPIGTLITSYPRTNEQESNEPLKETLIKLENFHRKEVSTALEKKKTKPKNISEFNKRDFAHSDIYITGYGENAYKHQVKFAVDPTTIKGEYATDPQMAHYIKIPTRHDTAEMAELMAKRNFRTWPGKRIAKSGTTTGPVIFIEHPDRSTEQIFLDDHYLANVGKKYGGQLKEFEDKIKGIENKIYNTEKKELIEKYEKQIKKIETQKNTFLSGIKPEIYRVFLQNDIHLGAYSTPGRTSLVEGVLSSQLVALQTYGFSGIDFSIMTEALNGEQAWRNYDSSREGFWKDPVTFMKELNTLERKLIKQGANDKTLLENAGLFTKEYIESIPTFKPEEQKEMFMEVLYPINTEMMNRNIPLFVGAGNHWMASKNGKGEDEANVIKSLLGRDYEKQGLLIRGQSSAGQSYSIDSIKLPSADGKGVNSVIAHKLWHGATEISQIVNQMIRASENSTYIFTADRHHPGAIAENGKMGVLDAGKQPTIPYRKMIGKSSSVRGTVVAGYGGKGELLLSTRYFIDDIIDTISGWEYKAGILRKVHFLIDDGIKENSIYVEMKNVHDFMQKNKQKYKDISKKLNL